jgi:hypothetical protein
MSLNALRQGSHIKIGPARFLILPIDRPIFRHFSGAAMF